jgi:hypothetical protein
MSYKHWLSGFVMCLLTLGLLTQPVVSVLAQSDPDADAMLGEEPTEPVTPKPGHSATEQVDEEKPQQAQHHLYFPHMATESSGVREASVDAVWSTIATEGFEGVWPPSGGKWFVTDYNGNQVPASTPGTLYLWDDTSTKSKTGFWSAHPTDGPPYVNLTDTYMRYGTFSLVGATDARFSFWYLMDTEITYDWFTWEFSCGGVNWDGYTRSGLTGNTSPPPWVKQTVSLRPCLGKSTVYIRFNFKSDDSVTDQGVWVDDIRIEKFQ